MQLKQLLFILPVALFTTACTTANQAAAQPNMMMAQPQMQQQAPHTGGQMAYADSNMQFAGALSMQQQALENLKSFTTQQMNNMDERVRRVERAMIRLDRRMQVIERSEMARISNVNVENSGFQPTSFNAGEKAENQGNRDYGQMTSPFLQPQAAAFRKATFRAGRIRPGSCSFQVCGHHRRQQLRGAPAQKYPENSSVLPPN